jgi:hypothetical protein
MATQKPDTGGWWYDVAEDFEAPLRDNYKWWENGDEKGPTENFICQGGINSQSDIISIAGHGYPDPDITDRGGFACIKLNGTDYQEVADGYGIAPHEMSDGLRVGHRYYAEEGEWKLDTYPPGTPTSGGIEFSWNSDMEWIILSSCGQLRNDTPIPTPNLYQIYNKDVWDDTLRGLGGRPAHGLFGYSGSPWKFDLDEVVNEFLDDAIGGSTLVSAWKNAVIAESTADYGIVMHADNENDKLKEVTRDTFNTEMKYWYSEGLSHKAPISYDDIGYIASEGVNPSNEVEVEMGFNPSHTKELASYLYARIQTVLIDGIQGIPKQNGSYVFRYDNHKKDILGKHRAPAEIARAIDKRFSREVNMATCFEDGYDAHTKKVTSHSVIGNIHEFEYVNPVFPIARSRRGNFVRVLTENEETVLVIARVMKPLAYQVTNELMISQAKAVEKLKGKLKHTNRFGSKCRFNRASLEYEDSGRINPDGTIELVPAWRIDMESEKVAASIYIPALETN